MPKQFRFTTAVVDGKEIATLEQLNTSSSGNLKARPVEKQLELATRAEKIDSTQGFVQLERPISPFENHERPYEKAKRPDENARESMPPSTISPELVIMPASGDFTETRDPEIHEGLPAGAEIEDVGKEETIRSDSGRADTARSAVIGPMANSSSSPPESKGTQRRSSEWRL